MDELINQKLLFLIVALVFIVQLLYRNSERFKGRLYVAISILIDIGFMVWLGMGLTFNGHLIFLSTCAFLTVFSWFFLLYPEQKERGIYTVFYYFQFLALFSVLGFCFYFDLL